MSEFPGLEKWYLQKKPTLSIQDVALWQMLPPHPQRTKTPAVLRVALWNGHVRDVPVPDRSMTAGDVIRTICATEIHNPPYNETRLCVDGHPVAPFRSIIHCFDGTYKTDQPKHLINEDGSLQCSIIIDPCPAVASGIQHLEPWKQMRDADDASDVAHRTQIYHALRQGLPLPERPEVLEPHLMKPPNHFERDSSDPEPHSSKLRFDMFMKRRHEPNQKLLERGRGLIAGRNENKVRPLRSGRWKESFPKKVPCSYRWNEKNFMDEDTGKLSADPSTIDELYKPFLMSAKERRQRSRGGKRVSMAEGDRPSTRGGTAVSQGRDAAADPLSPGDQESIDTLHGRHRRATVPRAMP